jgi:hypothetical protein
VPTFVPTIIYYVAAFFGTSQAVAAALMVVSAVVIGNQQQKKAQQKAREQHNASQVDRLANVVTSVMPRELVLGRVRKGGGVYFRGSAGAYKSVFMVHLTLAAHEIDAVEQIYFNDQPVTLDANGNVLTSPYGLSHMETKTEVLPSNQTVMVLQYEPYLGHLDLDPPPDARSNPTYTVSGKTVTFSGPSDFDIRFYYQTRIPDYNARVWWRLGDPDAAADGGTIAWFPNEWTSAHRARGVATLVCKFVYSEDSFPNGLPNVTAVIRGAKVYDPRTGVTAWSENPALLARHVYQHPYFGKAAISAEEDSRFIVAANACDTNQVYTYGSTSETKPLYRAALVATYGTPARSLLDDLVQSMAGLWAFAGGELYLRAGVYTAPVMTLTDADLAVIQRNGDGEQQEPVSISVHKERAQKFNVVNVRIWDAQQAYKDTALAPVRSSALVASDGAELAHQLTLPAVGYAPQAQHIAGVMMRDARDPLTVEAPFKLRAYPLELFDTVSLTLARFGWSAKSFMILARTWDMERGVIQLTLKETSAAVFTPDAEFLPQGYAENTALPQPWDIDAPVITVSSGTEHLVLQPAGSYLTRVLVQWPAIVDASILDSGQVEVQWCVADGADLRWQTVIVAGESTGAYLVGPQDGQTILVRARTRNAVALSAWSVQVQHLVLGKSVPPNAPTGVTFTREYVFFTPPTDVDLAGFRVLYNVGTSGNRSVATALHTGLVAGSPWPMPVRLYGTNTIIVVAVDTSGNESEVAYDTQDLGEPDVANIAEEVDYVALGFPGVATNCSLSAGQLVANADPSVDIYGSGGGSDIYYRDGIDDVYGGNQYLAMSYVDRYDTKYGGGTVLIDIESSGPRRMIEFRPDGSPVGDVYSSANADIYSGYDSIYGAEQQWSVWGGSIAPTVAYMGWQFRVSIDAGSQQGSVSVLSMRTEMPQIEQTFGNFLVNEAGTVLSPADGMPALSFISIEDVQITPIGPDAVAARVKSYPIDPQVGATVELINSSGVPVSGRAFIRQTGF